jgi:K+-transporting ATPase KdpF subunit
MMGFDYLVGAIGGVLMLIYLVMALLRSEKF